MKDSLLKVITSPLNFFVLALLIVEGFLAAVLIWSDLGEEKRFIGMCIGAGLFFIVILTVAILVKLCPQSLMFGERSLLNLEKEKIKRGAEEKGTKDVSFQKKSKKFKKKKI